MFTIQNPFYKDPEVNAKLMLQQRIINDSQRYYQQSLLEMMALRSLLTQGSLCFCIPIGGPFAFGPHPFPFPQSEIYVPPSPPTAPVSSPPQSTKEHSKHHGESPKEANCTKETKLCVSLRNDQQRTSNRKQDECRFRPDSTEIILDLRSWLPAEISVNVENMSIRVEVSHVDKEGTKTWWKQYELPACVIAEHTRCILSHDGFLHVYAPWYRME